jgi:hypothetical protein
LRIKIEFAALLFFVFLFYDCSGQIEEPQSKGEESGSSPASGEDEIFVDFDPNGGIWRENGTSARQRIKEDGTVDFPVYNPIFNNFVFIGWIYEKTQPMSAGSNTLDVEFFKKSSEVTSSMTVYALWQEAGQNYRTALFMTGEEGILYDIQYAYEIDGYMLKSLPNFGSKPHYYNDGRWWTEASGGEIFTVDTVLEKNETTLYPHWYPNIYVIKFFVEESSQEYDVKTFIYPDTTFKDFPTRPNDKEGYIFEGWSLKRSWAALKPNEEILEGVLKEGDAINENVFAYGIWRAVPNNSKIIRFYKHKDGEMLTARFPSFLKDGLYIANFAIPQTPERAGYFCDGKWYTDPEGGSVITRYALVSEDLNLYPHWVGETFKVFLHANEGGESYFLASATYPNSLGPVFPNIIREGYTLEGWYSRQFPPIEAGQEITDEYDSYKIDETAVIDGETHLYALWRAN